MAATPPGTRTPGRTASTRSCRRTGRRGRRRYLGNSNAKQTPANQEKVAAGQVHVALQVARQLAPRRLLVADRLQAHDRLVAYATRYVNRVMSCYKKYGGADRVRPTRRELEALQRRLERRSTTAARGGSPRHARLRRRQGPLRDQGRRDARRSRSPARGIPGTARSARPAARPRSTSTASYVKTVDLRRALVRPEGQRLQQALDDGRARTP